jgi:hypothetical protein
MRQKPAASTSHAARISGSPAAWIAPSTPPAQHRVRSIHHNVDALCRDDADQREDAHR